MVLWDIMDKNPSNLIGQPINAEEDFYKLYSVKIGTVGRQNLQLTTFWHVLVIQLYNTHSLESKATQ